MRITSVEVNNFKSLNGFRLDLEHFSCLIGLNGSGKSTILQFFDFLARLVHGDLGGWLKERGWKHTELLSGFPDRKSLTVWFKVRAVDVNLKETIWKGEFNPSRLRCTRESVTTHDTEIEVRSGVYRVVERSDVELQQVLAVHEDKIQARKPVIKKPLERIPFSYEGSILSQLEENHLPESILEFKRLLTNAESLDMLTPEGLRKRTRSSEGTLGTGGENLASFVFELGATGRQLLAERVRLACKNDQQTYAKATALRGGWKQLHIAERFGERKLLTEARHVSDGTLRLIAILAEVQSKHDFLLFDEIENGLNPEWIEFLLDTLVGARQQVLVTTHSPMILNYLEDEVARTGVIYIYKTPRGETRAIPFFTIPSLARKLEVMGPGEAFVDTDLTRLGEEISLMDSEEE